MVWKILRSSSSLVPRVPDLRGLTCIMGVVVKLPKYQVYVKKILFFSITVIRHE
jgi:hypothetical protein